MITSANKNLSDVTMSSRLLPQVVVAVQPTGLGGRDLLRWQTRPMTTELVDEIARVRNALSSEPTRPTSALTSHTHAAAPTL
jgi:hypothetical protein